MLLAKVEERMAYRIARGEQGVLTFEPRFKTPAIARKSAQELWVEFQGFGDEGDFVGMDMSRKFIQMGMTRAKRYANYKGGRKYDPESGKQKEKSAGHEGQDEKLEASKIFKGYWERCREYDVYQRLKEEFTKEQKEWDKIHPREIKKEKSETKTEKREVKLENKKVKLEEDS